jgi:hypothetical protein
MPQHIPPGSAAPKPLNISAPFPTSDPLPANLSAPAHATANGSTSPGSAAQTGASGSQGHDASRTQSFSSAQALSSASATGAGQPYGYSQDPSHGQAQAQYAPPPTGPAGQVQADSNYVTPGLPAAGGATYGVDLGEQLARDGGEVPRVVEKCVQAVEAYGMSYC